MINKLRAKFTQTRISNPRKTSLSVAGGAYTTAACLAPFDGGITLFGMTILSVVSLPGSAPWFFAEERFEHQRARSIEHLGQTYISTEAQKNAYNRMELSIQRCQREFNTATEKRRKKLQRKAQKNADMQQWLVDGLKPVDKASGTNSPEFKIERGRSVAKKKAAPN